MTCPLKHRALVLVFALTGGAFGDTVVYRDSQGKIDRIEADVKRVPSGWELRIPTDSGAIMMTLDPDQVVEIIRGGAASSPERVEAQRKKDPRQALEQAVQAWRSNPATRLQSAAEFRQAVEASLVRADELARSLVFEEAMSLLDLTSRTLAGADGGLILADAGTRARYQTDLTQAIRRTRRDYSRDLAERATRVLDTEDALHRKEALDSLQKAVALDETNALGWLGLARFYHSPNNPDVNKNTIVMFAAAKAIEHAADERIKGRARAIHRDAMNTNQKLTGQTVRPELVPDLTPTPRPRVVASATPTPPGAVPPPPAGTPAAPAPPGGSAATPAQGSTFDRLKSGDWSAVTDLVDELLQSEYAPFAIGIVAFVLFYWFIPAKLLRWRARKGSIPASIWVERVRYLGFFTLFGFLVASLRMPRRARDRCPICKKAIDNLEDYGDFNFYVCPHCGENITPVYSLDDYIQHLVQQVEHEVHRRRGQYTESTIEKDATLKLVRAVITQAVRTRASDLHIDVSEDGANIRCRIDGVLYDRLFLPKTTVPSIVSAIKVMAELDIAERRVPQDGKCSIWVDKADIDCRVNTSPAVHGEKVSIRLLDQRRISIAPVDLGFEGQNLAYFEQAIQRPHGLLVVTGPSGSGKSTTLYVALNAINTGDKNIITLEDPIEYKLKGLNQMQVNPAAKFTFATGLRSIVRQDPDVIMVGEVRDKETAEMAIEAAVTGHLVMTTMHTIDTTTIFTRLTDMGIDTRRYAAAIVLILAQRLIRVNCPECRKRYEPEPKNLAALRLDRKTGQEIVYLKGEGCPHCQQTGYYGRCGLFEVFAPDRQIAQLLEQNAAASKIREMARRKGMRNIREEGVAKIMRGESTVEEIIRATM